MANRRGARALAVAALAVLGAAACDDTGPAAVSRDPLVDRLVHMGFSADQIEDRGDHFVVEGDMILSKASVRRLPAPAGSAPAAGKAQPAGPQMQWRTPGVLASIGGVTVTVDLRQLSTRPEWATAVRQAMQAWSSVGGSGLRFTEVNGPGQITFSTYNTPCSGGSCTLAQAAFPSNYGAGYGDPGNSVRINVGYNWGNGPGGQPTASSKLYNMVHELGHTVGLRHTNWWVAGSCGTAGTEAQSGSTQIARTPDRDDASIMNRCTANNEWYGFSYYDRVAMRTLYPGFQVSASVVNGQPTFSWTAAGDATEYRIYYGNLSDPAFSYTGVLATTTGTSYTDTMASASGVGECGYFPNNRYYVAAVFPEGIEVQSAAYCFNDYGRRLW